jgi:hypothetical protein
MPTRNMTVVAMPNREILMGLSSLTGNRCGLPVNLLIRMDGIKRLFCVR